LEQRRGREEGLGELAQTVSTNLLALTGNGGGELEWSMVRMVTREGVTHFTVQDRNESALPLKIALDLL
jgi:hypothetical protein